MNKKCKSVFKILVISFLSMSTLTAMAQSNSVKVKGVVSSSVDQNPLIGVSVIQLGGGGNGTSTDLDGKYELTVPAGAVLQFSYLGYTSQEVTVAAGKTVYDIVLQEDTRALEEVVVVGYGIQKRSVVTAAISRISTEELDLEKPNNVQNALKGKVSGVQITSNSGQPGADSKIYIRGVGTVNDSNPLYVIDGMPSSNGINYLNPSDIASIEILKDAASAAIYGARGANGVVLVTTKNGKANSKTQFNYDFSYGMQNPEKKAYLMSSSEYQMIMNEMGKNSGRGDNYYFPTSSSVNTDWMDVLAYKNAPVVNHKLSVAGGGEKNTFFASFSALDHSGLFAKGYSNFNRYNGRLNTTHVLLDTKSRTWLTKIELGSKISYTVSKSKDSFGNSEASGMIASMNMLPPTETVYQTDPAEIEHYQTVYPNYVTDADGRIYNIINMREIVNPLASLAARNNSLNQSQLFTADFDLTFTLLSGLTYKTTADFEWSDSDGRGYTPAYDLNTDQHNAEESVWNSMNKSSVWQWENIVNYTRSFDKHNLTLLGGASLHSGFWQRMSGTRYDPLVLDIEKAFLDISGATPGDSRDRVSGSASDSKTQSFFGRVSYDFDGKYLFEATVRRDGSSNFGPNNRYGTFPAVSVGWVLTGEKFMESTASWLNFAKLRVSWGQNGNDRIGSFGYVTNITKNDYRGVVDDTVLQGAKPDGYSNPNLKWETSEQTDLGLDLRLFKNALSFSIDYFDKQTKDMLCWLPLPDYTGFASFRTNVGTVNNKGVEFESTYKFHTSGINFGITGNASYVQNKVIDQGVESPEALNNLGGGLGGSVSHRMNGYPYGFFYGYAQDGIYQNQGEVDKAIQANAVVGGIRWKDIDGNGKIDADDRTMIGKPNPDWTYGLLLSADYRGFDFSAFFQGVAGVQIYKLYRRGNVVRANFGKEWLNRWHGEGTSIKYPVLYEGNLTPEGGDTGANIVSDLYVEDGDYFRLKVLQIGYTLPTVLTKKALISKLRLFLQGENLFTLTGYTGLDAEVGTRDGFDGGTYPQPRVFTFGLNISF
jgi:TonB-linked SusC/RagA family outer membrane protein